MTFSGLPDESLQEHPLCFVEVGNARADFHLELKKVHKMVGLLQIIKPFT